MLISTAPTFFQLLDTIHMVNNGVVAAGLIAPIESSLTSGDIACVIYDGVEPEPPSRVIDGGAEIFKTE
jgi:alcohol dehydrogenase class IV